MKVVDLSVNLLREAGWNSNIMGHEMTNKLKVSLDRFGVVEALVVRQVAPDAYEVLGGNQRLKVLNDMGVEKVPCVVVELDDAQAMMLAQALNGLHGEDDMGLKAELLRRVMAVVPQPEVLALLPETAETLGALASLGQQDLAEYLKDWEKARAVRLRTLQVRLTAAQLEVVEEALARFLPMARGGGGSSPNVRGTALFYLCKHFLEREADLP